ncbi:WecB/TagA/CpsF family glycosyltransferase [Faecalicatena acetigenes]|uniref:WecB/TagA/CpsF family glycosyltransferase n=1 Tax=Faecalicatena acetigenes TaxID=2981790 RepID=A0ABT2T865_9FIRM|nr:MULTISPECIES: WecB/TagA/CpsF family glycosyltransferase [Lachnospiraceae]MCU6746422.1 WecB/TagA/CpsF family glycosyltransferase [Faecalicatena acetigenes]SCH17384.1 glycosyltransferase%2C WecB/TagA/CpsF family [uncultured Clostridium sp.]
MKETINIFDVYMQNFTAKEAMKQVIAYLETESLHTIEIVTMDMLLKEQENVQWKDMVKKLDMVLPGEREILEAAGVQDKNSIRDAEEHIFLKLFLKYLQKNRKKIFLLADKEEQIQSLSEEIRHYHRGIVITGGAALVPDEGQEEKVINEINGTETDCLVSMFSSPWQEQFIAEKKALLNVRLWIGCGPLLMQNYTEKKIGRKVKTFFLKKLFRYRVEKQKKEKRLL